MPQLIPAGVALGGSLLSAIGKSGKQSGTELNQTSNQTSNQSSTGQESYSSGGTQTTSPLEEAYFANFRKSLIPQFNSALARASQPLYGKPEQAMFMQSLNDLASGSVSRLKQNLARSGQLDSGRFGRGVADIEMDRLRQAANFNASIPQLNQQAYMKNISDLLGLGMNFAGRAPLGQTTTSSQSGSQNTSQTSTGTSNYTGTSNQSVYGPSAGGAFLNSLGGMFGAGGQGAGPFGSLFKKLGATWGGEA